MTKKYHDCNSITEYLFTRMIYGNEYFCPWTGCKEIRLISVKVYDLIFVPVVIIPFCLYLLFTKEMWRRNK